MEVYAVTTEGAGLKKLTNSLHKPWNGTVCIFAESIIIF